VGRVLYKQQLVGEYFVGREKWEMAEGYSNASPGLDSIMAALQKLYPDQPNPPQMASVVKYW